MAIAAACFYTAAYAAMNVGAFAVVTQITGLHEHTRTIEDFTGVALRRPWLGALLAFFLLSMIGIPFTGGFFGQVLRLFGGDGTQATGLSRSWVC